MAIVILKASKATPSKGLDYILDGGKAAMFGSRNLDTSRDFAEQMMETAALWGKAQGEDDRKYYHLKVSFHPDDWVKNGGTLTEKEALVIGMGVLQEFFPNNESVGSVHADKKHLHFHGIVNAVSLEDGKMIDMRTYEYAAMKDRVQELCAERGLNAIDWRKATVEKREKELDPELPIVETHAEDGLKSRGKATWKDELRSIIDYAAANARDMDEFKELLAEEGVTLTRCTEQTISYKLGDHRACRGDKLGGDYTAAAIRDVLEHNAATPELPEGEKPSLMAQLNSASVRAQGGRVIDADEREVWRELGRVVGVKRSEIDGMCDYVSGRKLTRQEKSQGWDSCRSSRDLFYEGYNSMQSDISNQLSDRYAVLRKYREIEWLLDPRNHRSTLLDMIFAMIMMALYKEQIEQVRREVEELKVARAVLKLQQQQFKQASAETREALLDNDTPKEEYLAAINRMQNLAEDMCRMNFEQEMMKNQRTKDWER